MNFLIAISIIYLIYFGTIYYKILIIVPVIYKFCSLINEYKHQIFKLNYCYDSDNSDLESGNSSDSDMVVDDLYIVNDYME